MQHLEVSDAVRPLKWSLGVKWLRKVNLSLFYNAQYFPKHGKTLCFCVNKSLVMEVQRAGITIKVHSFYISLNLSSLLRDSTALPLGKEPPIAI